MAEILGIVVAASQLVGQTSSVLFKTKRILGEINQTPEKLNDLAAELQVQDRILSDIKNNCPDPGMRLDTSSIDHFFKVHSKLSKLIQELSNKINATHGPRRKFVLAKIVLEKKSTIDKLESQLTKALQFVQVSISSWPLAYMKAHHARNMVMVSASQDRSQLQVGHSGASSFLQYNTLRNYNLRSSDDQIFTLVCRGDLVGMLTAFTRGDALPSDRDLNGRSLLYYAAAANRAPICNKLIEIGLDTDIDEVVSDYYTPRQLGYINHLADPANAKDNAGNMGLFQASEYDSLDAQDCQFFLFGCSVRACDLMTISQFQRCVAPLYFSLSIEERLEAARAYCLGGYSEHHPDANVLSFLVWESGEIRPADYSFAPHNEYSLVHSAAISLGRTFTKLKRAGPKHRREREGQWAQFIKTVIAGTEEQALHSIEHIRRQYSICVGDLACESEWVGTPLLSVLHGSVADSFWNSTSGSAPLRYHLIEWKENITYALKRWLSHLKNWGVNLLEYGRREHEICSSSEMASGCDFMLTSRWWSDVKQGVVRHYFPIRLCRFEIGLCPDDWSLCWDIDSREIGWRIPEANGEGGTHRWGKPGS